MVTKTPGICGGRACIENSRMPVWTLENLRRYGFTVQGMIIVYPHLTADSIESALSYAKSNPEEIQRDIDEQKG